MATRGRLSACVRRQVRHLPGGGQVASGLTERSLRSVGPCNHGDGGPCNHGDGGP